MFFFKTFFLLLSKTRKEKKYRKKVSKKEISWQTYQTRSLPHHCTHCLPQLGRRYLCQIFCKFTFRHYLFFLTEYWNNLHNEKTKKEELKYLCESQKTILFHFVYFFFCKLSFFAEKQTTDDGTNILKTFTRITTFCALSQSLFFFPSLCILLARQAVFFFFHWDSLICAWNIHFLVIFHLIYNSYWFLCSFYIFLCFYFMIIMVKFNKISQAPRYSVCLVEIIFLLC